MAKIKPYPWYDYPAPIVVYVKHYGLWWPLNPAPWHAVWTSPWDDWWSVWICDARYMCPDQAMADRLMATLLSLPTILRDNCSACVYHFGPNSPLPATPRWDIYRGQTMQRVPPSLPWYPGLGPPDYPPLPYLDLQWPWPGNWP